MQNLIELINLIKNIVFISHIFACIWLIIGRVSLEFNDGNSGSQSSTQSSSKDGTPDNSWINQMNLEDSPWYTQYLYSYYFITVTMCTVGYGDIRPTNPLEVSISVFLIITCCIVFGFTLNSIGEIFQDFFTKEKIIQEKRYVIANYMDKNQIDENTRKNIFEYLEYYWKESLDENLQEENKIISQLSDNLKEELLIQSNKLILKESKVLKENFSLEILSKCIPIIKEQKLTPGEVIIQQEEGNLECCLIFVLFGELEIYNKQSNNSNHAKNREPICLLSRGDSFGEKSFFSGETQSLSVKSRHFSKILKIKRGDFMQVIKEDKLQYEKFIYLQDKLRYDEQISYLHSKCQSCFSNLHQIEKCPSLHFIPKKMKIFGANQISLPQVRNSQFKRTNKKYGTLEHFPYNTQAFLDFLEVQFEDLDLYDQRYFQYTMFKTRAKQTVEDDEFDTVKNIYEVQRSKQITNDFLESPKVAAEKKKLSFKKKSGQITFQNNVGSFQIFSNGEYSDKDIQNQNKIKNIIVPQMCQDSETLNQFIVAEQPSSSVTTNEQEIPYLQLNDNQLNNIERILQQNRIASVFKRSSSKDNNIQCYERIRNRQETQIKIAQRQNQNAEHILNYESKSSVCMILEENEFDLLLGKFESQENYIYYFPKYNLKNVINQLNPHSCQSNKLKKVHNNISSQIKDNYIYSKQNKNIHQLLKERDVVSCRSITRSKGKIQSESSLDKIEKKAAAGGGGGSQNLINKTVGKNNFEKELQKITIQLDLSQQNFKANQSVINESKQYELYEDQISIKLENEEDPQTPPQNELQIPQLEIISIGLIKNQNYNFSSSCLESSKVNFSQYNSKK
ncbi:cyclic nucleotide-binding domain protein (macronuclear) [Tetrahymena thermophila SB210]|uniref:Cyclic nucleotide-binding domain protein n=1 Tax=Tetrahymena thermophila (strain SB210) TaxID=312017 RepID=Q233R5_TETTS|nr:cyclic nucleotide-binding domain protein [Tetrahymena thermophila SB210]EAR91764.3 cyclic nucleotide-binding domain protein [Tetrahymena thermophila SB210]|eukprot:XP_001012009.3 cyclic nucleotide-binding domain protein [Tetrahymena thermophila SB210]